MLFGLLSYSSYEDLSIENTRKQKSRGSVSMQNPRYMCVNLEH